MKQPTSLKTSLLALGAACMIAVSAPLMAEHGTGGPKFMAHGNPVERLTEELQLDPAQAEAIEDLFEAHRQAMSEVEWRTPDGERNPEARAVAKEARLALDEEIRALLTEEQAEKFDTIKANRRMHIRGDDKGHSRALYRDRNS